MKAKEKIKEFIKHPEKATELINNNIGLYRKYEIALMLKVSRPTLDKYLKTSEWRLNHIELIVKKLYR